jgi:hypothetical protein
MAARSQRTRFAFTVSIAVHAAAAVALTFYILVEKEIIPNPFDTVLVTPAPMATPKPRRARVRPIPKPIAMDDTPVAAQPKVTTRASLSALPKTSSVRVESVLEFATQATQVSAPMRFARPRVVRPTTDVPQVVTTADLPVSDSPDALAFSAPVARGRSGPKLGRSVAGRGIAGPSAQLGKARGLTLVEHVGAALDGLGDMAEAAAIGYDEVRPLPKRWGGGRVVGVGKNIRGVFRLVRVKHDLSDWWADSSSLNALTKWLNEKTQIKTDMNVEGGAVRLTDANLHKSPLLWMTGHDPSLVQSRGLLREGGGGSKLDSKLGELEAMNLRKYLTVNQGMLVFDDCGVNAPAQAMIKIFQAQMRVVMPEYGIERLSNDHPVYRTFYELAGPPVGFDIFWWGTKPPKRNYLEGISVGDKLVAMMIRRDYMCAMEAVNLPTRSVNYSPGVYRWATNVVVYSLTTGNIADYSDYVPANLYAADQLQESAPQSARIATTPLALEE